jgi:hypothetical protein
VISPFHGGLGEAPLTKFVFLRKCLTFASIFVSIVGRFFSTWFFADGFLFLVKELGLLTNPGHRVRFLNVVGSYMYIIL